MCRHVDTGLRRKEKCAGMLIQCRIVKEEEVCWHVNTVQDCEGRRSVLAC